MSTRTYLAGLGYGFLITFVGLQEGDTGLTSTQGQNDAASAATLANDAGFTVENTVIYLDVESGPPLSTQMISYIDGWINAIVAHTIYMPGVYCSYETADQIKSSSTNAGNLSNIRYWVWNLSSASPGCITNTSDTVADSGVSYASSWQYAQTNPNIPATCSVTYNGTTLDVDLDLSNYANPSDG